MLQNDLDKGQIVEQRFIGFFNLHKMDGQVIQNAMMDIETQDILNALFEADQEIIDTLLNARPPRERDMIRSELESGKQYPIKSALPQEKSFLTKFESLRNKLLVILLFQATVVWSQRVYDFDKSIERLTHGFAEDFGQLIIPGNRVYVMSTEYNSDVDAYVADKIREGITLGVKESKYNLVYQPFFKDHVVRKVYSSDTSFRIQYTSFLRENYKGMRAVLDSLDSYGIDHFIASEVSLNKENQLLSLNVFLVETSTLLVKWAQRYYSDPRFKSSRSTRRIGLGIQVSDLVEAESFRDYGTNSSSSIVGPYQDPVRVQSVEVNYDEIVNQKWEQASM